MRGVERRDARIVRKERPALGSGCPAAEFLFQDVRSLLPGGPTPPRAPVGADFALPVHLHTPQAYVRPISGDFFDLNKNFQ